MSCPQFEDNKRKCFTIFGRVVSIQNDDVCSSDDSFQDCIFYKMLSQNVTDQCQYMEVCSRIAVHTLFSLNYEEIKSQCEQFCLSTSNQKNCAIYQLIDGLKEVPKGLLPDGRSVQLNDE